MRSLSAMLPGLLPAMLLIIGPGCGDRPCAQLHDVSVACASVDLAESCALIVDGNEPQTCESMIVAYEEECPLASVDTAN